jgi:hypothetical protein
LRRLANTFTEEVDERESNLSIAVVMTRDSMFRTSLLQTMKLKLIASDQVVALYCQHIDQGGARVLKMHQIHRLVYKTYDCIMISKPDCNSSNKMKRGVRNVNRMINLTNELVGLRFTFGGNNA